MKLYKEMLILGVLGVAVSTTALADRGGKSGYQYARVVGVDPIVRYVQVTTPVRECWDEVVYEDVYDERRYRAHRTAGPTILGGLIGGVIGHQFGHGRGRDAMTVAGTLVGAAIANDHAASRSYRYASYPRTTTARTVERCEVRHESHPGGAYRRLPRDV